MALLASRMKAALAAIASPNPREAIRDCGKKSAMAEFQGKCELGLNEVTGCMRGVAPRLREAWTRVSAAM